MEPEESCGKSRDRLTGQTEPPASGNVHESPTRSARSGLYTDRTPGGHRDYRGLDRLAAPCRPGRPRSRPTRPVRQQSQTGGLAIHNYLSAIGTMPPGRFNSHVAGNGNCWGGYSQMLPQLEQQALFNAFNFSLAPELEPSLPSAAANATGASTFLNTLLCPSDSAPAVLLLVSGGNYAGHNYDLNVGSNYPLMETFAGGFTSPFTGAPNGPFFENRGVGPAEFTDGLSNTVAASETIRSNSLSTYLTDPKRVFLVTGDNKTFGPPLISDADYASLCLSLAATTTQFQATKGVRWHYGAPGTHDVQPSAGRPTIRGPDCRGGLPHSDKSDPNWSYLSLNVTTRSLHPGGVNSADGRWERPVHREYHQSSYLAGSRISERWRSDQLR